MKFIKLFESFGITTKEVLEDIKSIAYILEDNGYDISYEVLESRKMVVVKIYLNKTEVGKSYLAPYGLSPYDDDYYKNKLRSDGDRFLSLVREHLDYIPSHDIVKLLENFPRELGQCYYFVGVRVSN